jgi:hypothetical protein
MAVSSRSLSVSLLGGDGIVEEESVFWGRGASFFFNQPFRVINIDLGAGA